MKQIALSLFFFGPPMEVWYLDLRILLCVFFLVQCLNKPYPGVWLEGIVDKSQKPSRTLQTNRQTSPLDPNYILPSGPSIMPSGEKVSTQVLPFPSLPYCKFLIDPRSIFCPIWRNFRLLSNSILWIYLQAQTHHCICAPQMPSVICIWNL
jgi:hypothetical protein